MSRNGATLFAIDGGSHLFTLRGRVDVLMRQKERRYNRE